MVNTLTGGKVTSTIGGAGGNGAGPLADFIEMCNEAGADLWLNLPNTVSDTCVASIGDLVAANGAIIISIY